MFIIGKGRYARESYPLRTPLVGGWQTAFDENFSTLPSETLGVDGLAPIGGLPWVKSSSANDRAPLANVNGQGLVWQLGTHTSSSILSLPIDTVLPASAVAWSTSLRLWIWIESQNYTFAGDLVKGSIQTPLTVPFCAYQAQQGLNVGPAGVIQVAAINGGIAQQALALSASPGAGQNVMLLEVPGINSGTARYLSGAYVSGAWPAEATEIAQIVTASSADQTWQDPTAAGVYFPNSFEIALFGASGAGSAAFTFTIGRVRMDFQTGV